MTTTAFPTKIAEPTTTRLDIGDPLIECLTVHQLKADDVIVVKLARSIGCLSSKRIRDRLAEAFPKNKVIIVERDAELEFVDTSRN